MDELKREKALQEKDNTDGKTEAGTAEGKPGRKKRKAGIIAAAVVSSAVVLLAVGYIVMAGYYRTHFFPGSNVNGIDCGDMEAAELAPLLDAQIDSYCLKVWRPDDDGEASPDPKDAILAGEIMPGDIALSYVDTLGGVEDILEGQNEWGWIQAYLGGKSYGYSLERGIQFDEEMLKTAVNGWKACKKENMRKPQNAYISEYSDEIGGYEVVPEIGGTELDMEKVLACITSALYARQTTLDLWQEGCYTEAEIKQTDKKLNDAVNTANTWLGTKITYDWNGNEVILDIETLKDWITMEQDGPALDEDAVKSFVKAQARKYDTFARKKKFVTALGVELKLESPNYGWKTDSAAETEELIQLIYRGSVTEREPVYSVRAMEKGKQDIGGDYVEADLTHQHLYVYQEGQVVFETDFVSGKTNVVPSRATPPGIFGLTYKTRNATLRGADYESFVNYWMPFYGNYGMHDATWRRDFGGTIYQDHGSHGCINLPVAAAEVIYDYVSTGFPIVCYYYEVDPLAPPAEAPPMPTEEELRSQEEPTIGQDGGEPAVGQGAEGTQNQEG